eukprot:TRINITY_DN8551_c1_g1_i1.p1 TRINITY_DN8551_c1_g1~~TRINITY_DN8551_c1_g1_i1.p1  ORF type:complete len:563 (+),score=117.45 TRINITY_DN8551_c1_g1_i1:57-1745(+)
MGCAATTEVRHQVTGFFTDGIRRRRIEAHRLAVLAAMKKQYSADSLLDDEKLSFAVGMLSEFPIPIILWDEEGTVIHANGAALELLEHDDKSLRIGHHISKLLLLPKEYEGDFSAFCYRDCVGLQAITNSGAHIDIRLYATAVPISKGTGAFCGLITPAIYGGSQTQMPAVNVPVLKVDHTDYADSSNPSHRSSAISSANSAKNTPRKKRPRVEDDELEAQSLTGSVSSALQLRIARSPSAFSHHEAYVLGGDSPCGSPRLASARKNVHFSRTLISEDSCTILDSVQQPTMLLTANGQIVHWNPACERVFGPTSEEMQGHNASVLVPDPYHQAHERHIQETLSRQVQGRSGSLQMAKTRDRDRLSAIPRPYLLRQSRDVVARTLRSRKDSQSEADEIPVQGPETAEKKDPEPAWTSQLVPIRIVVAEVWMQQETPYWLVVCAMPGERSRLSQAHKTLMRTAAADTPDQPALLPEKPSLESMRLPWERSVHTGMSPRDHVLSMSGSTSMLEGSLRTMSGGRRGRGGKNMSPSQSTANLHSPVGESPPSSPSPCRVRSLVPKED